MTKELHNLTPEPPQEIYIKYGWYEGDEVWHLINEEYINDPGVDAVKYTKAEKEKHNE